MPTHLVLNDAAMKTLDVRESVEEAARRVNDALVTSRPFVVLTKHEGSEVAILANRVVRIVGT